MLLTLFVGCVYPSTFLFKWCVIFNMADMTSSQSQSLHKSYFKCCKNKEINHLVCIECFSIYHKSCLLRANKRSVQFISENKIKCCGSADNADEFLEISNIISKLTIDNEQKDEYIRKLKNDNSSFAEEAIKNEDEMNKIIHDQAIEIGNLKKYINKLKKSINSDLKETKTVGTQTEIKTTTKVKNSDNKKTKNIQTQTVGRETMGLKKVTKSVRTQTMGKKTSINKNLMITTTEETLMNSTAPTLPLGDNTNPLLVQTISSQTMEQSTQAIGTQTNPSELAIEYLEVLDEQVYHPNTNINSNDAEIHPIQKCNTSNKIVVIGDESAKNFSSMLKIRFDNSKFSVQGFVYPNIDFLNLTKTLFNNTIQCGQDDFVIFMFNTINVSNSQSLNLAMNYLLPLSKMTNLVILSKCVWPKDQVINNMLTQAINRYCKSQKNTSIRFMKNKKQYKAGLVKNIVHYILYLSDNRFTSMVLKTIKTNSLNIAGTNLVNTVQNNSIITPDQSLSFLGVM